MEGDYRRCGDCNAYLGFQSTPSAWRETYVSSDAFAASYISIHSLRMEGDRPHPRWTQFRSHFNPLPPHGGRHWIDGFFDKFAKISIHSLRMEGDAYSTMLFSTIKSFQSTPSAWRETHTAEQYDGQENAFQSTPSAWRETSLFSKHFTNVHISIHSLRMEGDTIPENDLASVVISIHSLRMEGDCG